MGAPGEGGKGSGSTFHLNYNVVRITRNVLKAFLLQKGKDGIYKNSYYNLKIIARVGMALYSKLNFST